MRLIFALSFFLSISSAIADDVLRIGALLHVTGEFAPSGGAFAEGIQIASKEANASGGVNGRKIELVIEDTQYKPVLAVSGAKKISAFPNLIGVLVTTATEVKAAGPFFQKAKIPTITLWDSSPEIENIGNFIFGIGPWAPSSGETAAKFSIEQFQAKTAVIIGSNTEWSQYVSNYFSTSFTALGGKIIQAYLINPDETDYRTSLLRIEKQHPDVIYCPIDGNVTLFFKQVRQVSIKAPMITSDIVTEENLVEAGSAMDGIYQTLSSTPDSPTMDKLRKLYQESYGNKLTQTSFVAWGYDATNLIVEAARKEGPDPEKMNVFLHKVKNFPGASGAISMNSRGSAPRPVDVYQAKSGKFEKVWTAK